MGAYTLLIAEDGSLYDTIWYLHVASFLVSMVVACLSAKFSTCKEGTPLWCYEIISGWIFLLKMYELSVIRSGCAAGGYCVMLTVAIAMLKSLFEQADNFTDSLAIATTYVCDKDGFLSDKLASAWGLVPLAGWFMPRFVLTPS